jgi:hypothetical protein
MAITERLNGLLADLHAHRVATFKPEDLAVNVNQRQFLVDHADQSNFIRKGNVVASFTLPEVGGGNVVIVIGQDHVVQFAAVSPDWLVRSEADEILAAVRSLIATSKAA